MLKLRVCKRGLFFLFIVMSLIFSLLPPAFASDPIKIGVTMPLSGPLALNGKRELNGIQLAVKKINSEGGILNGRKLDIIAYDDKGNPEEAVSTIKKLINQDKVVACVTGAISTPALAQKEVTREAKMIHIIVTAQHPNITKEGHPYLFRLNSTIARGADAISKYVIGNLKPKSAWYLGVNDDFGRNLAERYKDNFDKAGIEFLGVDYYNKDDTDFMTYLVKAKGKNPGIIMLGAPGDAVAATILRQRMQLQITSLVTQCMGVLTEDLVNLAGKNAAEGVYSADSWTRAIDNAENKWFIDAYEKEYKGMLANKENAIAFEAMKILAEAMDKAKSATDANKISQVLHSSTFDGLRGKVTFDETGQAIATDYPIVVRGGVVVLAQ